MDDFNLIEIPKTEWDDIKQGFQEGHIDKTLRNHFLESNVDDHVDDEDDFDFGYDVINWTNNFTHDDLISTSFEEYLYSFCVTRGSVTNEDDTVVDDPLYSESSYTVKDWCRYLLYFKAVNSAIGDRLFACIIGAFGNFLPQGNAVIGLLSSVPSMYHSLQIVNKYGKGNIMSY